MEQYFGALREHIFKDAAVLIYVFDVSSKDTQVDLNNYESSIQALQEFSKDAKVFVLIHQMDKIPDKEKPKVFEEKKGPILERSGSFKVEVFGTSIWDETLYKAWSQIAHFMIPKIGAIESGFKDLCQLCSADELVLFEKQTFLEITHIEKKPHKDPHRFEKISNIIKQFKLSLFSSTHLFSTNYQFQEMMVKNSKFRAYLLDFTKSTYLMVVISNKDIEETALKLNIETLKPYYDKLISGSIS